MVTTVDDDVIANFRGGGPHKDVHVRGHAAVAHARGTPAMNPRGGIRGGGEVAGAPPRDWLLRAPFVELLSPSRHQNHFRGHGGVGGQRRRRKRRHRLLLFRRRRCRPLVNPIVIVHDRPHMPVAAVNVRERGEALEREALGPIAIGGGNGRWGGTEGIRGSPAGDVGQSKRAAGSRHAQFAAESVDG